MNDHDASPTWSKLGRNGTPSRKCLGKSVIRHLHDVKDRGEIIHRKGDPVLDEDNARQYKQCIAWAANGTDYCSNHGGSAPQTINAAKRVLALGAESAARGMKAIADDENLSPDVRLKAQVQILDRVGVRAGVDVGLDTPGWQKVLGKMFGNQEEDEESDAEVAEPAPDTEPEETKPRKAAKVAKPRPVKAATKPMQRPKFEGWG